MVDGADSATYEVRVLLGVDDGEVDELDVVVLVNGDKSTLHHEAVLELDDDGLADQGLEKGEKVLRETNKCWTNMR